jgi:hypothetical protein
LWEWGDWRQWIMDEEESHMVLLLSILFVFVWNYVFFLFNKKKNLFFLLI